MFSYHSDLQDLQDTLTPYWISKIQQITKFSPAPLPKVPKKKKHPNHWRQRAYSVLDFMSETPSLMMRKGKKHGHAFMNDTYYKNTRLTLAHYRQAHQDYSIEHATEWVERVKNLHDWQHIMEKMFAESLMLGWDEWTQHLQPLVSSKMELGAQLLECVRSNNIPALRRFLPHVPDRDVTRACHLAMDNDNVEMMEILIERSGPTSQNSRLLQMVARDHSENDAMMTLAIKWCDPAKAARHLLYLRDPAPADRILANPATSLDVLPPSLEYAATNQQDLPHARARYENHVLAKQVLIEGQEEDAPKRKM